MVKGKGIFKYSIYLGMISMLVAIVGFFKEILIGANFGATRASDAFFVALTLPMFLWGIYGDFASSSLIPLYIYGEAHDGDRKREFIDGFFSQTVIFLIGIFILVLVFRDLVIRLQAPGFSASQQDLMGRLMMVMFPGVLFLSLSEFAKSYLNGLEKFLQPTISTVFQPLSMVVTIVLFSRTLGVISVAVGFLAGSVLQTLFLWAVLWSYGVLPRFKFKFKFLYYDKVLSSLPMILTASIVFCLFPFVDRAMASYLNEGSVAALGFADKLTNQVRLLFAMSVGAIVFPHFSRLSSNDKSAELGREVTRTIKWIFLYTTPIMILFTFASSEIISVIFKYGIFGDKATQLTSSALAIFSITIILGALGIPGIGSKLCYSKKNFRIPAIASIIFLIMKVILNPILVTQYNYLGIAISTAFAYAISNVFIYYSLARLNVNIDWADLGRWLRRIAPAIIGMILYIVILKSVFLRNSYSFSRLENFLQTILLCVTGSALFFFILVFRRIEEVLSIQEGVMKKLISWKGSFVGRNL